MGQGVILQLSRCDIECSGVGVFITLVRVELMESVVLILLCPSTVRRIHATIDPGCITSNRCNLPTLLKGTLTNVHTTSVTHAVRFTATIFGTETVLHELLVRARRHLNSSAGSVRTMETVNTGCGLVRVLIVLVVTIRLESSGILCERLCRDETFSATEP